MHEFLSTTSQELLSHRYCDLRYNEFLRLYPFKGGEMGLEIRFFFPEPWMLFYATPIMADDHVKRIVEQADDTSVNINNGHMSANYAVDGADEELGKRALPDFTHFDSSVSKGRLSRYWAAFRNSVENYIIRHAGEKIDQRLFDLIVYISLHSSFFKFKERLDTMPDAKAFAGIGMMELIGQGYAKAISRRLDISVLWHRPTMVLAPAQPEAEEQVGQAPVPPATLFGQTFPSPGHHGYPGHQGHAFGGPHHGLSGASPFAHGKSHLASPSALSKGLHGQHHPPFIPGKPQGPKFFFQH
mmetsp:Transcript_133031/g.413647  ORF Transcript_133031/g.413647 Transcript_133031/m.413647 type:complete len:299 (+) Transcript_133031:233-1129(+)